MKAFFLTGGSAVAIVLTSAPAMGQTAVDPNSGAGGQGQVEATGEIIVTANKREESINRVPMSIQALSSDELLKQGVTDTSSLVRIVPGFNFSTSRFGTPVFSLRGIGFHDNAMDSSPTVSVYLDQAPLQYSILSTGATLDVERVEVLKGPQGTLFGSNATGGAINYIAAKPTDTLQAGFNASYGRFNEFDGQAYVSGPLSDNVQARISMRYNGSGPWQYSYTRPGDSLGSKNLLVGRLLLDFQPSDRLRLELNVNGFRDRGETQAPQLQTIYPLFGDLAVVDPRLAGLKNYPLPPKNNRATDFGPCVNNSVFNDGYPQYQGNVLDPSRCVGYKRNNRFIMGGLRGDYDLSDTITLTSLTSYNHFWRFEPTETDGTRYQNYETIQSGEIETIYQELRVAGSFASGGTWLVGGNYEHTKSTPRSILSFSDSTSEYFDYSVFDPTLHSIFLGPVAPTNRQKADTYAVFGNVEYPILDTLKAQGAIRYTKQDRSFTGCNQDGDGSWSYLSYAIQRAFFGVPGVLLPAGACPVIGDAPTFLPGPYSDSLSENNVSWRAGLTWEPQRDLLFYANVSKGYKNGAYPSAIAPSAQAQFAPVTQESVLAYEAGLKATLFDRALQLNAAGFYYDYKDKQIIGSVIDPVWGPLNKLVNIPNSHVVGFEASAELRPVAGLRLKPVVSFTKTRIDSCSTSNPLCAGGAFGSSIAPGNFVNISPVGTVVNLTGESFPYAPKWQINFDAQYDMPISSDKTVYVGMNVNHQSKTNAGLGNLPLLDIDAYTLVDLRAGIDAGAWTLQVWGRNVFNKYYWDSVDRASDAFVRYTGRPATYGLTVGFKWR